MKTMQRLMLAAVFTSAFALAATSAAWAQRPQGGPGGPGGPGGQPGQPGMRQGAPGDMRGQGGPGGQFDRSRFEEMMMNRIREELATTDEEWKIIEPRLKKVNEAQMNSRMRGRGGFMGRRGPGGEEAQEDPPTANLRQAIESGSADSIKTALTAYRDARKKAEEELAKAREELRAVLTIKQEAQLVMMGTLD